MRKYFVLIIGTISAGKSTFLKAFLGINVFQVGETTTTKFICLIQNNKDTKFYHVIPKKEETLSFVKDGLEIEGEDNIKQKIEEINKSFEKKQQQKMIFFICLRHQLKT